MNKPELISITCLMEDEASLPVYSSAEAAGADVRANVSSDLTLEPGTSCLVPTGLRCNIPVGFEIQVRPRSGLALKHQVTVLNSPGTVDSDYRGEIKVILINHGPTPFVITPGMRIAQFVVAPVIQVSWQECKADELISTGRGAGGFGHTGLN